MIVLDLSSDCGPSNCCAWASAIARSYASLHSAHLPSDSRDCRSDGAAIIQVVFARTLQSRTISSAEEKSLPVCRDQIPALNRARSSTHVFWYGRRRLWGVMIVLLTLQKLLCSG